MSAATPPTSSPPPVGAYHERPYYGSPVPPLPAVSGEIVVFSLVWVVIAVATLASRTVDATDFVWGSVVLAAAYMLARGIAKAGKVFEGQ